MTPRYKTAVKYEATAEVREPSEATDFSESDAAGG